MDEFQHFERLDTGQEFEGGEWIDGEFFHRGKKKGKVQQTQEDRLYGVFQGSSDEEGGKGGRKRKRRDGDDTAVLHKPVGFVSTGVITDVMDDHEETDKLHGPQQRPREPEEASYTAPQGFGGLGLGARGGLGLGAAPSFQASGTAAEVKDESDEGDSGDEAAAAATGLAREMRVRANQKRSAQNKKREVEVSRAKVLKADPELAKFESSSKGIGSKLLRMMGWKPGEGLGAKGEGIAKPLQAGLRPKNAGLGATGAAEPKLGPDKMEPKAEAAKGGAGAKGAPALGSDESAVKTAWKQRTRGKAVKGQVFRTAEQLLEEQDAAAASGGGAVPSAKLPSMTILDMTGPQTRVVTDLEHLNNEGPGAGSAAGGDNVPFPELQHNMRLLVEMTEADIQQIDAKLRHERDTAILLQEDVQRLKSNADEVADEVARATAVLDMIRITESRASTVPLSDLEAIYARLQADYPNEYTLFDAPTIALGQLLPRLKREAARWAPLTTPAGPWLETFTAWKALLERPGGVAVFADHDDPTGGDPFGELVMAVVFEPLRRAVMGAWQPRHPEALLQFCDHWVPIMPSGVSRYLLTSLVMPRLRTAVNEWDPLKDAVPIHTWLHAWLPYLQVELAELYPVIRAKLAMALQAWQPWDASALAILKPWHAVWERKEWDALTARCITPPLLRAMHDVLNLNPLQKDDRPCDWTLTWAGFLSRSQLGAIYVDGFFPKLHQVLHFWLSHTPDYDEVWAWFEGYKRTRLPQGLSELDAVRVQLSAAFSAINSSQHGLPMPVGYPAVGSAEAVIAANAAAGHAAAAQAVVDNRTLKEWLEIQAAEAGLSFVPRQGRLVAGLQVHALGKLSVVIDAKAGVLKAFMADRWVPMALAEMIELALGRG